LIIREHHRILIFGTTKLEETRTPSTKTSTIMSRTHSGTLKQQVIDGSTGDYEWVRRNFQLVIGTGLLHVKSVDVGTEPIPSVSIVDAAYAKAWSISSAAVGFGFDIVWESGTIASFLASDKDSCHMWVQALNESIRTFADSADDSASDVSDVAVNYDSQSGGKSDASARPPLPPSGLHDSLLGRSPSKGKDGKNRYSSNNNTNTYSAGAGAGELTEDQASTRDSSQWVDQGNTSTTRVLPSPPRTGTSNSAKSGASASGSDAGTGIGIGIGMMNQRDLSEIPAESGSGSGAAGAGRSKGQKRAAESSDAALGGAAGGAPSFIFDSPQRQQLSVNQGHGQQFYAGQANAGVTQYQQMVQNMSNSNISSADGGRGIGNANGGGGAGGIFEGGDESLLFQLQQKCLRLQAKAERETIDAQVGREQLVKLQTELDHRSAQYSRDTDKALEREKLAVSAIKAEVDMKVLRATNEATAHHDLAMQQERQQAARELSCLKEELTAERKRYAALLAKETTSRERAEAHEVTMRQELTSLQELTQRQQAEISRLHNVHKADAEHWERERNLIRADAEAQRKRVDRQQEEFANKAQVELRTKLADLSLKFDSRVKEMQESITETVRQQEEGRRLQEMQVIVKQCERDIETSRTEERRSRVREVESLRSAFKDRERQTAEDLVQLEQLHNERLHRLEQQNEALLKKIEHAEKEAEAAKQLAQRGSVEVRLQATQHMQQAETATQKAEALVLQSSSLRRELQESRVREGTYREQLSRALDDNRLQRAELLETQKQLQSTTSEGYMWRKQAQEADMTHTTGTTTLQIARDEISMLEHELARVKEDNYALQQSLHKAEKLVYGQPQTSLDFDFEGNRRVVQARYASPASAGQQERSQPMRQSWAGKTGKGTLFHGTARARPTFGTAGTGRQ